VIFSLGVLCALNFSVVDSLAVSIFSFFSFSLLLSAQAAASTSALLDDSI
jgi:hypothetical protein